MEKLLIEGGHELNGTVRVSGAKNSAVALLPATILAESEVTIEGLPDISDIQILKELLEDIGGTVSQTGEDVTIDSTDMIDMPLPNGKVKKLPCVLLLYGCYARSVQKSSHRLTGWM